MFFHYDLIAALRIRQGGSVVVRCIVIRFGYRPTFAVYRNATDVTFVLEQTADFQHAEFVELDQLFVLSHIKAIIVDIQRGGIEPDLAPGVEHKCNAVFRKNIKNEQRRVFIPKIDFFKNIPVYLGNIIPLPIPCDRCVEIVDDFLVFEPSVRVAPVPPAIQPKVASSAGYIIISFSSSTVMSGIHCPSMPVRTHYAQVKRLCRCRQGGLSFRDSAPVII